jgi:hypothetical protein
MKKLFVLMSFLILNSACSQKQEPQESCNFVQNSSVQRVSWKDAVPIHLYVHDTFPAEHLPALRSAMARWERTLGRPIVRDAGVVGGENAPARDGVSGIYWMNSWETEKPGEQARTTIYWEGNRIKEADIKVNAKNFRYSSTPDGTTVDIESLLVHELGHVMGLQHNTQSGSVMALVLDNGQIRRDPAPNDVQSLKCEY